MSSENVSSAELGQHLKLLRIKNKLTMMQVAQQTGITQGYISQIENGIHTPSAKTLAKLARAYKVAELQLLRKAGIVQSGQISVPGSGERSESERDPLMELSDTGELMDQLRRGLASLELLNDHIRQRDQFANMPSAEVTTAVESAVGSELLLPVYDASWSPVTNAAGEHAVFRLPAYLCAEDKQAFIMTAGDNAMSPLIKSGDWVVVSPESRPSNGHAVAINKDDHIQLRNYHRSEGKTVLVTINPDYSASSIIIDEDESVEIIGRVVRLINREI
jgi:SOS-response transcriptional repressor LexA